MRYFITAAIAFSITAFFSVSTVRAENVEIMVLGQPTANIFPGTSDNSATEPVKTTKTKKKKPATNPDLTPGQKVTYKQVVDILNSTRNLSGLNLSGLNLVGVDLSNCSMMGTDLNHANLERTDLRGSDLELVDFTGANLKMANFHLAGITGARLDNAILDGAIWIDRKVCAPESVGQCNDAKFWPYK